MRKTPKLIGLILAVLVAAVSLCCMGGCNMPGGADITAATASVSHTVDPQSITTGETAETTLIEVRTPAPVAIPAPAPSVSSYPLESMSPASVQRIEVAILDTPPAAPGVSAPSIEVNFGDKGVIKAPAGSVIVCQVNRKSREAEVANRVNESSQAVGNAVRCKSDTMDLSKLTPPQAGLSEATGGGAKGLSFKQLTQSKAVIILIVLGGLLIVAGVVIAIWLKQIVLGIALAIAGVCLIGTGVLIQSYPWMFLIPVGLFVAAVIAFVFYARKHGGVVAALRAIITGVEAAPADAQAAVKPAIADAATTASTAATVKSVVTDVKTGLGL